MVMATEADPPAFDRHMSLDKVKLESLASTLKTSRSVNDYYGGCTDVTIAGLSQTKRYVERERLTPDAEGVVLALVGLPARGKSFISRKLERFLLWRGYPTRTFNVGKYRRDAVSPEQSGHSSFFDRENASAVAAREAAATAALDDALRFLDRGGKIAILDATNSTAERRKRITDQVNAYGQPYIVVFLEAICEDVEILEANMLSKVKNSPDFWHLALAVALDDLKTRITKYDEVYQSVEDFEGPYIKLYDLSSRIVASRCYGRLAKTMLPFVMAIHIGSRPIWLVRASEGEANPQSPECDEFQQDALRRGFPVLLAEFVSQRSARYWKAIGKSEEPVRVLTSTLPRAVSSACRVTSHPEAISALNPVDKGVLDGCWWEHQCRGAVPRWEELQHRHSAFYARWARDPFKTRFPEGESYLDVVKRLESVVMEIEMDTRPVLVVSHLTALQLLMAYFRGSPVEEAWRLPLPKNTVLEISPTSGGGFICEEHHLSHDPCLSEIPGQSALLEKIVPKRPPSPCGARTQALHLEGDGTEGPLKRLRES